MATESAAEVYDLLILVDATYSMFNYLESLKTSLPKVIAISNLTNSFARIGLLAYRDYTEADRAKDGLLEWSGWYDQDANAEGSVTAAALMDTAASLEPIGGGDYPEATKTGLARACSLMREDATTIILFYTDAPPHCWMVAEKDVNSNYNREQMALKAPSSYAGFGKNFADWVSACKYLHQGPRKAHVFCFLDNYLKQNSQHAGYYTYLSTITRGACFFLTDSKPHSIAQVTVDVLLGWMGTEKAGVENTAISANLIRYTNGDSIRKIKDEKDATANQYFWASAPGGATGLQTARSKDSAKETLQQNIAEVKVDSTVLKKYLPKKTTPLGDFAVRYAKDANFKKLAVEQLKTIIETDVTSMSLNPVFGMLWRAVCNDRENPARDELITAFGLHVEKIKDAEEKTRMKNWLEESYDYAAEVLETLEAVPADEKFPCVFLDPTIEFQAAKKKGEKNADDEDEAEANRPITAFRRDELLEIGRSCDGRILRRLGKILTRLTYVESAADLPAHIAATTNEQVPKIPLSLASQKHGWNFWKMLLHVVLPGTMLSARPATVLAALAIRIGLKPLFKPASAAMLFWRDRWNNIEVPETWNSSCIGLLLDADAEYRKQTGTDEKAASGEDGLLLKSDRKLFTRLIDYQHTSANLLTTLTANIGWTPEKTRIPVGPIVTCKGCEFPRSITMMVEKSGGKCGLCVYYKDSTDEERKKRYTEANVTKETTSASNIAWVECTVRTCRAQYVCYNPDDLNVRPKCHYCRVQPTLPVARRSDDPAPTLECKKCLSKVIWPNEWRGLAATPFLCTACTNDRTTIVSVETNAQQLCKDHGQNWLLRNDNEVLQDPLKRSLFFTISTTGQESFLKNVEVLPRLKNPVTLTIRGKQIRNQDALIAELQSWIKSRRSERTHCSLCFSTFPNNRLFPPCRRRGCHQRICKDCLDGWYGLNSAGSIINTAALSCPFCRRLPAAKTLAAHGMGVHAVTDLNKAIEERGQWVYAWCYECSTARRYMERECARGAPEALNKWQCEECDLAAEEEARAALAAAVLAEEQAEAKRLLELAEVRRKIKDCPKCKTPTQKTYGCDHMACPIPKCGCHWCWKCSWSSDSGPAVYRHMGNEHGGLHIDYSDDEDDEDEDEDDY